MSTDASIRRVSISEQARMAAERFLETGEAEPNPHQGPDAAAWDTAFVRWVSELQAVDGAEASA